MAGQQLVIAQLQASNATDTVNFLANKFTNAPLYDWMAGVLQGVYSFFLQQATAVAMLAENQLAFERQRRPPGYIKSSYWQPASANLLAAQHAGQHHGPDRRRAAQSRTSPSSTSTPSAPTSASCS